MKQYETDFPEQGAPGTLFVQLIVTQFCCFFAFAFRYPDERSEV